MRGRSLPLLSAIAGLLVTLGLTSPVLAADSAGGGEATLVLPDLGSISFLSGVRGDQLLSAGLVISLLGIIFGLVVSAHLKRLPVHRAMHEISELIYETCKTYLVTQGRFI